MSITGRSSNGWRAGIPKYKKKDVLSELELHKFCVNTVAEYMQNEGYVIEGILIEKSLPQIMAHKDGKIFCGRCRGHISGYRENILSYKRDSSIFVRAKV